MSTNVLRDLHDLRIQVVHPPDDDGRSLVEHLRRIGCSVDANWPVPEGPAANAQLIMLVIDYERREEIRRFVKADAGAKAALIAIVDYENSATLQVVIECGALAVVEKPIRPFGLLTNVILARTIWLERQSLHRKLRKLEHKVSGVHKIQRAKSILMQSQALSEEDAYKTIRIQAMAKRISMEDMASAIINAHELLTARPRQT